MNPQQNNSSERGFTIIEVVLVLAIAGLIFLMVFIALPALQRSQRDTQRRDDLARVSQALTQYQTNNNGRLPWQKINGCLSTGCDGSTFLENYITKAGDDFSDPSGDEYTVHFYKATSDDMSPTNTWDGGDNDYEIAVYYYAKCSGETTVQSSNARDYAVMYDLEGSGVYCESSGSGSSTSNSGSGGESGGGE